MKAIRRILVRLVRLVCGEDPTDAEIVARSRHPDDPVVRHDDVGLGLYIRWGRCKGPLEAFGWEATDVDPMWRDIALAAMRDNSIDVRLLGDVMWSWYICGLSECPAVPRPFDLRFAE